MKQHVVVTPYNPEWGERYKEEAELLKAILKDNLIAIYHIGSTSVPNLAAKPIIDIMIAVRSLEAVDQMQHEFNKLGYEALGEFGIKGRRYLRKGGENRTHQVHIFHQDDHHNLSRHLAFREFLSTHDKERDEYGALKLSLAEKFPYDIESYCDGKDEFIKKLETKALSSFDYSWERMYIEARKVQYIRTFSRVMDAGSVAAAVLAESGKIYVGVCIDSACSLGMCAERNAIANMITNGESKIKKVLAINRKGCAIPPCGSCREFMTQFMADNYQDIQIMLDYDKKHIVSLKELTPAWWL